MNSSSLGNRIKLHRLAAGLSLRELAEQLTVTPQAVNQYELGQTKPRPHVLHTLAEALDTRVERLVRPVGNVELKFGGFRDSNRSANRTLAKAESSLISLAESILELEQRLGSPFPSPSLPRMPALLPLSDEDAEELAQDIRHSWMLGNGPLTNLVSLFESKGIRIFESLHLHDETDFKACSGLLTQANASLSEFPAILLRESLPAEEKRFALARELAFMVLPNASRYVKAKDAQRRFSRRFAMAFLLPASKLRELLGRRRKMLSGYELSEVKHEFGIGYDRVVERCRQVEIISRDYYRQLRSDDQFNQRRRVSLKESSSRLRRLAIRAATEELMALDEVAALLDVDAEKLTAWIDSVPDQD